MECNREGDNKEDDESEQSQDLACGSQAQAFEDGEYDEENENLRNIMSQDTDTESEDSSQLSASLLQDVVLEDEDPNIVIKHNTPPANDNAINKLLGTVRTPSLPANSLHFKGKVSPMEVQEEEKAEVYRKSEFGDGGGENTHL